jgi:hypothetical protein
MLTSLERRRSWWFNHQLLWGIPVNNLLLCREPRVCAESAQERPAKTPAHVSRARKKCRMVPLHELVKQANQVSSEWVKNIQGVRMRLW